MSAPGVQHLVDSAQPWHAAPNVRLSLLLRIKRCCLTGRIVFTEKAEDERVTSSLSRQDVIESIVNAAGIYKTIRSTSAGRAMRHERLYVIVGVTHEGILVYTKGTLRTSQGEDRFYVLVSAKRSIDD
jgi:hypothetical protein